MDGAGLVGAKGAAAEGFSNGSGGEVECFCGRARALREREGIPVLLAAGEATTNKHGLMFARFGGTEAVEIGERAGETDVGISGGVSGFGGENFAEVGEGGRVRGKGARGLNRRLGWHAGHLILGLPLHLDRGLGGRFLGLPLDMRLRLRALHGDLRRGGGALHAVGDGFEKVGIGERELDGDADLIERPDAGFQLHGHEKHGHEGSALRLAVFVGVDGELDLVEVADEGVAVDDELGFLAGFGIGGGEQHGAGLEGLQGRTLCVELAGEQRILLKPGERAGFFEGSARDGGQVLEKGSRLFAEEHFVQGLACGLRGVSGCRLGRECGGGQDEREEDGGGFSHEIAPGRDS